MELSIKTSIGDMHSFNTQRMWSRMVETLDALRFINQIESLKQPEQKREHLGFSDLTNLGRKINKS